MHNLYEIIRWITIKETEKWPPLVIKLFGQ